MSKVTEMEQKRKRLAKVTNSYLIGPLTLLVLSLSEKDRLARCHVLHPDRIFYQSHGSSNGSNSRCQSSCHVTLVLFLGVLLYRLSSSPSHKPCRAGEHSSQVQASRSPFTHHDTTVVS